MNCSVCWTNMHAVYDNPGHQQGLTEQAYNKQRYSVHRQCCGGKRVACNDMREFPLPLCLLRLLVIEYQPLLFGSFHSMGNKTSNPLKSLMTGKTQAPLCEIRYEESSMPNAR